MGLSDSIIVLICVAFVIWLVILSWIIFRISSHYNHLVGSTSKHTLREVMDELIKRDSDRGLELDRFHKAVEAIKNDASFHIQKIGIIRFNPFDDTGGNQSFTLALLDGSENGIIMTSLYARTGNRWYIKQVHSGKGIGVELSKEEQSAISNAHHVADFTV